MIDMRQVNVYCGAYAVLLDIFGNKDWFKEIVRVAKGLLKLTVRQFIPGFHRRFADVEDKGGVPRWLYQSHLTFPAKPTEQHLGAGVFTDGHDLDKDLSDGSAVVILTVLHANREFDPETREVYKNFKDFCYGLWERRALYTKVFYPDLFKAGDLDFWSKPLNHPTTAFGTGSGQMFRMFGGERFKRGYERAKAELLSDRELIETPHGLMYSTPHGVQEGYKRDDLYKGDKTPEGSHDGQQDNTYFAESITYAEVANRAKLDLFDDRTMEAIGNTLHHCAIFDGYDAPTIGGSIGGGGRARNGFGKRKRQINLRNGEAYPSKWWEPEAGFRESVRQFTRNLTTLPLARVMTPEIESGLRQMLKNAEDEGLQRYGPRLTLLVAAAERA